MPSCLVRKNNGSFILTTKKITSFLFLGIFFLSACISNKIAYKENENPQNAAEPSPSVNASKTEEPDPNGDWDEDLEDPKVARTSKKTDNKRRKRRSPLRSLVETQQSFLYPEADLSDEIEPSSLKNKSNKNSLSSEEDSSEILLTQSDTETRRLRDRGPKFSISAKDVDIKTILFSISKEIDQNILIDPSIKQKASVDLKDVPLREVLEALLTPLKLKYTIEKNYIRETADKMETRIFHLNYIISRRQGSSNLQSSSGSQISGAGISGGTSGSGNARTTSSLLSSEETDLWNEITVGLRQFLSPGTDIPGAEDSAADGAAGAVATPAAPAAGASPLSAALGSLGGGASPAAPAGDDAEAEEGTDGNENSTENGFVSINKQAGLIIVKDFPEQLLKVAEYLEAIEGSTQRQVYIQAQILEVNLNDEYRLGIDWSTVTPISIIHDGIASDPATSLIRGTSNLTYGISNAKLNLVVEALQNQGSVSVLSSPKIATLNNQRAVIKVGTEDVFFVPEVTPATTTTASSTTFQPATVTVGIILDVLPQINVNGQVMMSINTSISERTGTAVSPDGINRVPILNVREANNVVLSQNGQTIIIGGLMQDRKTTGTNGVPLLEDLPIFGRLFQRELETTEKTELVILLTPEVLAGKKIDERVLAETMEAKKLGVKFN
jgi:MSHA type pilus biogenesis protein MshL